MKIISLDKGAFAFILGLLLWCSPMHANSLRGFGAALFFQSTVTGRVTDGAEPLPGVSVLVKGTGKTAVSDGEGNYTIQAGAGEVLVFSFVGYATAEIAVTDVVMNVALSQDAQLIQELVINAGYYSVKQKEATGSIARITAKEIENQPVANVLAAMQGRMAGVNITQNSGVAGGGFSVQIRGVNSLRREGNLPLYIIDGVPVSEQPSFSEAGSILPFGSSSVLNAISPNDIESIEVLKDADATAIYGSRGGNGVILITTKKGRSEETSFTVNSSHGFSTVASKMDMMDTPRYLEMRRQAFANDGIVGYPETAYDINGVWDQDRYTDWQETLIGRTASNSMIQLGISGGSRQTKFSISGSHAEQATVFSNKFSYKTTNLATNISHSSADGKFRLGLAGLFSSQANNVVNEDQTRKALLLSPNAPELYQPDGSLNWEANTFTNPVAIFESTYANRTRAFNTSLNLSYELLPSLHAKFNGGINYNMSTDLSISPHTIYNPAFGMTSEYSTAFKAIQSRFSYLVEPQLQYGLVLGSHRIDVLAGATFQQTSNEVLRAEGYGFQSNALITNLAAATTKVISQDSRGEYNYGAMFGRVNYTLHDRYILNITGRRDGSSRFGPDNRFADFGAVGAAWLFSREGFIPQSGWLSYGKLRGSYGVSGSDLVGDYQYLDTYSIPGTRYGGYTGLIPSRLYNPDFSWEKTKKLEAALEAGLLKDRIRFTAAWYRNRSGNQLVGIPLPGTTGFSSIVANLPATVENKGWEFELGLVPVDGKELRWELNVNASFPKNKLLSFPGLEGSTYANRYVVGSPASIVKLYNYEGIDPQTGLYRFTDMNGDGAITSPNDNTVVENIGVRYFGGLSSQLSYKGLNFSFLFQFVKQRQFNYNNTMPGPGSMNNQPTEVTNVWSPQNPQGTYMPYTTGTDAEKNRLHGYFMNSTAAVGDASFIRLKNVQLSYAFRPGQLLSDVKLFVQGQNLLTITDYFGLDPEFALAGYLPPLRTYSFGVQLNF